MKNRPRLNVCRRRFTLIELLVVIAIIVVLMSLLLPVFQKVKDKARAMECLSNLHQVGIMQANYAGDYRGWSVKSYVSDDVTWALSLSKLGYARDAHAATHDGKYFYSCPTGLNRGNIHNALNSVYGYRNPGGKGWYPYFRLLGGGGHVQWTLGPASYTFTEPQWSPSNLFYMADNALSTGQGQYLWIILEGARLKGKEYALVYARHLNRANSLFIDGHAKGLTVREILDSPVSRRRQKDMTNLGLKSACYDVNLIQRLGL